MNEQTDYELITLYLSGDQEAMRTLVERHYNTTYKRFRRELGNVADAEDTSQQLWLQVSRNLERYEDQGKFPQYLSTIASNLIKLHWRSKSTQRNVFDARLEDEESGIDDVPVALNPEQQAAGEEAVRYLSQELIPGLPPEQRMAWLLRHESEYWDPETPMKWQLLAELNGLDVEDAWGKFEQARETLMCQTNKPAEMETDELSIFLVWTQAQRATKELDFTWNYFSKLLGVPVNTMKTRYRAAQQRLASSLEEYRV